MEKENNGGTLSGSRNPRAVLRSPSPSPRLCRSKSGSNLASLTTPENSSSRRFNSSQRFASTSNRSKSTSKTRRAYNNEENMNLTSSTPRKSQENSKSSGEGFGRFLQRGVSPDSSVGGSKRTPSKSPSAWALSPGRFLGSPTTASESPGKAKSGGNGVSKVLKYFKKRNVSSVQEDEFHRFRILHNRLLQWRLVNARAEAAMANAKKAAEINIFSVWLTILVLRRTIMEKKMERQKLKHRIKLYEMINPQLWLLNEWATMERKNEEYVSRLTRKLSALSICLPLHDLKVDVESVYQAMKTAIEVMESIHSLARKYQRQVERILYQVTELTAISKQQEEYFQELLRLIPFIATSVENEKSIIVHLIQTKLELKRDRHFYIAQSSI